jgi:hypothetical protein
MSDDSPSVYERDGLTVYRASDLGGCITRLAAARQGQEKVAPKGFQQQIFDAGNDAEEQFFARHPELAHYRQLEVTLHITPRIAVMGHLDAYEGGVIEVKSQSGDEYAKWTWDAWTEHPLWVKYSWQVSACMLATSDPQHPLPAVVWRVNREDGTESAEEVKRPFWSLQDITERILEVEALAHSDKLTCTTPDFFCAYPYLHVNGQEPVDDDELDKLVKVYISQNKQLGTIKGYQEETRAKIVERLDILGMQKVLLMSGHQVTRSEFDTKDHMVKGSHQVRVTITEGK